MRLSLFSDSCYFFLLERYWLDTFERSPPCGLEAIGSPNLRSVRVLCLVVTAHLPFTKYMLAAAGPLIITGVALGIRSVTEAGGLHLNDVHKVLHIVQIIKQL